MLLLVLPLLAPPPGSTGLKAVGRLEHAAIREASGIVQSRRYAGVFWVHNDSGNLPILFAVRSDGSLIREYRVAAPNVDWEDIATDDAGRLYIGDIGNNGGKLPVRTILCLDEPDPSGPSEEPLRPVRSISYRFPDGRPFDAEGLFVRGDQAFLIRKRLDGVDAGLYTVPLDRPAPMLRPALARRCGSLPGFPEPATGASLSADGRTLAVCSYGVARVYRLSGQGDALRCRLWYESRFASEGGIEAVTWDGRDLILAGEGRGIYRIVESSWRRGRR
jgi:hypothetical protein